MSSHYRPILVSPSYALFVLAFSHMALAENTDHDKLSSANSATARAAVSAARELIELMADRLELKESIARSLWNEGQRIEDDKSEIALSETSIAAIKEAGLDPVWAEAFFKNQMLAAKEFQRQLFAAWKSAGVYAFDDVADTSVAVRSQVDKNTLEQIKRLQELKGVLCSTAMVAHVNETASSVFARRRIERQLLKILLASFDVHAREESGSCPSSQQAPAAAPQSVQVQHVVNRMPN